MKKVKRIFIEGKDCFVIFEGKEIRLHPVTPENGRTRLNIYTFIPKYIKGYEEPQYQYDEPDSSLLTIFNKNIQFLRKKLNIC